MRSTEASVSSTGAGPPFVAHETRWSRDIMDAMVRNLAALGGTYAAFRLQHGPATAPDVAWRYPVDEEAQMIWWILLAVVVVLLALGLVLRRRKGSGTTRARVDPARRRPPQA